MTSSNEEIHVVQALSKLEQCQIALGVVKMLSEEEDRLCEVDDMALLKVDLGKAKLGPALLTLSDKIKEFAVFVSSLPRVSLEKEPLSPYALPNVVKTLNDIHEKDAHTAIDRWKDILVTQCNILKTKALPENWKKKCVETYDVDYVKNKLLTQSVFDNLGSDYPVLADWLISLDKCNHVCELFSKRWAAELKDCRQTVGDAVALVTTILAYNVLVYKFPKQSSADRRQSLKDV